MFVPPAARVKVVHSVRSPLGWLRLNTVRAHQVFHRLRMWPFSWWQIRSRKRNTGPECVVKVTGETSEQHAKLRSEKDDNWTLGLPTSYLLMCVFDSIFLVIFVHNQIQYSNLSLLKTMQIKYWGPHVYVLLKYHWCCRGKIFAVIWLDICFYNVIIQAV